MSENQELDNQIEEEAIENEIPQEYSDQNSEHMEENLSEELQEDSEEHEGQDEETPIETPKKGLPDWALKNPKAWGEKRAKETRKEALREYNEKIRALEEKIDALSASREEIQAPQSYPDLADDEFYDEELGAILKKDSPEGMYALLKQSHEKKKKESHQINQVVSAYQQAENKKKEALSQIKKFVDVDLEKYIKNNPDSSKDFEKIATNPALKGAVEDFLDFGANLPNNGPEFLHYLSKSEREIERLAALDPRSRQRELLRHNIEFHSKNRVSNAPPPSGQGGSTISSTNTLLDLKSMHAHLHNKYKPY